MPTSRSPVRRIPYTAVLNFVCGLMLISLLSFVSGCLLDRQIAAPSGAPAEPPSAAPDESPPSFSARDDLGERVALQHLDAIPSAHQQRNSAIDLGAQYLMNLVQPDGQFIYKLNIDPAFQPEPRYNMLRHCGTMYALGMYHEWQPDERTRAALARTAGFLMTKSIAPVPGQDGMLAVWSRPEITLADAPLQAKLGGSGLGLVALAATERAAPDTVPIETMRGLGRFILFLQKDDGSFHSKYIPVQGGRRDNWTSLYYPGEAALGLLQLHELDPDPQWLRGSAEALHYLARTRHGETVVPADHWALLATAKLMAMDDSQGVAVDRDMLVEHAAQICEAIMQEQVIDSNVPKLIGGFSLDGRTTPTATRLEGLLAALQFMPEDREDLRTRLTDSVQRGMSFLSRAQFRSGEHAGAVTRAVMRFREDGTSEMRSFNRRATEVRIDYVQHALSAMIQYVELFADETATASHPNP